MVKKIEHYPELVDPQLRPRYSGIPTFFRLPHTERLDEVDIGIIGVPFDGGVTNRPGARHGPRDIRHQSSLIRKINQATGVAPFDLVRVADLGDAWIERPFELEGAHAEINAFFATVHAAGVTPLSVGGDHSISLPILRAIARNGPLGLVHVDAHCDTGDDYLGSRFHHGASFRRAVEERLIDPKRAIQIGIRGTLNQADMWQFSHDQGMRVVSIEEFHDKGWRWAAEEARVIVNWDTGAWWPHDARGPAPDTRIRRPRSCRRRSRRGLAAARYQRHDEYDGSCNPVRAPVRACAGSRPTEASIERLTGNIARASLSVSHRGGQSAGRHRRRTAQCAALPRGRRRGAGQDARGAILATSVSEGPRRWTVFYAAPLD